MNGGIREEKALQVRCCLWQAPSETLAKPLQAGYNKGAMAEKLVNCLKSLVSNPGFLVNGEN